MSTVSVPCPHCAHVTQIPIERLPDRPAGFACPKCKKRVVADRNKLLASPQTQKPQTAAAATPPAPRRAKSAAVQAVAPMRGSVLQPPADAVFPSGLILGEDSGAIAQVQEVLRALGSDLKAMDSPNAAREAVFNEQPELCLYVAGTLDARPHAPLAPLTALPPQFRRHLFLVLVADNVQTLDGNAAFAFQVNMTLARADVASAGPALYTGIDFHRRLYTPYFAAEESRGSI